MILSAFELGIFLQYDNDFAKTTLFNKEEGQIIVTAFSNFGTVDTFKYIFTEPFDTVEFMRDEETVWVLPTSLELKTFCSDMWLESTINMHNHDDSSTMAAMYINRYIMEDAPLDSFPYIDMDTQRQDTWIKLSIQKDIVKIKAPAMHDKHIYYYDNAYSLRDYYVNYNIGPSFRMCDTATKVVYIHLRRKLEKSWPELANKNIEFNLPLYDFLHLEFTAEQLFMISMLIDLHQTVTITPEFLATLSKPTETSEIILHI